MSKEFHSLDHQAQQDPLSSGGGFGAGGAQEDETRGQSFKFVDNNDAKKKLLHLPGVKKLDSQEKLIRPANADGQLPAQRNS
mmetsp:Transcript_40144/g.52606  ORF Transcript_40144/g.52606 Transcript_40144/m.52606 type:complete len:82 (+) Transcript_40144:787-1032(+)|eukprot:CAMPEP_0170478230 /NCGR_PEP_ID=MMETSP0123-20130129/19312_1 /TAXON_ID=182087 /ORGANISM="Favella ehrenbergii, Strain Fehren 1" /LENGTH=81 /DNA_ID=CAMNT_0010750395 /DNA_START=872 /DNA_END=1117 /DNA_ORIENTATION=+